MSDNWLYKYTEAQANLEDAQNKINILEAFYKEIVELTVNHDVIRSINGNEYASVSPTKIGEELSKVNPKWYEETVADNFE